MNAFGETPEELKAWRSDTPIRITHDERGNRLPTLRPIRSEAVLEADEDELVFETLDD